MVCITEESGFDFREVKAIFLAYFLYFEKYKKFWEEIIAYFP
jgi:hypothetical protein